VAGAQTRATAALVAAGVPFEVHEYARAESPRGAREGFGSEAVTALAGRLNVAAAQLFKTLVVTSGAQFGVAVLPVPATLSLKAAAAALGLPRAELADLVDAGRVSGYVVGGIAPLGLRRTMAVAVDESALRWDRVLCSAGRRGLEISLAPQDLIRVTGARVAALTR
jgi:Cys-tRNA(Pro)/Cys-tRNA(Cys) deacylase